MGRARKRCVVSGSVAFGRSFVGRIRVENNSCQLIVKSRPRVSQLRRHCINRKASTITARIFAQLGVKD